MRKEALLKFSVVLTLLFDSIARISDELLTAVFLGGQGAFSIWIESLGTTGDYLNVIILLITSYYISNKLFKHGFRTDVLFRVIFSLTSSVSFILLIRTISTEVIFVGYFPIPVNTIIIYLGSLAFPLLIFMLFFRIRNYSSNIRNSIVSMSVSLLIGNTYFILDNYIAIFEVIAAIGLLLSTILDTNSKPLNFLFRYEELFSSVNRAATNSFRAYADAATVYSALFISSLTFIPDLIQREIVTVYVSGFVKFILAGKPIFASFFLLGSISQLSAVIGSAYLLWYWTRLLSRIPALNGDISPNKVPTRPRWGVFPGLLLVGANGLWLGTEQLTVINGRLYQSSGNELSSISIYATTLFTLIFISSIYFCYIIYKSTQGKTKYSGNNYNFPTQPITSTKRERIVIILNYIILVLGFYIFLSISNNYLTATLGPFWLLLVVYIMYQLDIWISLGYISSLFLRTLTPGMSLIILIFYGFIPFQTLPVVLFSISSIIISGLSRLE